MMILFLAAALIFPTIAGYFLVTYFIWPNRWPVQLVVALSLAIGIGMVPQLILLLDTCQLDWNLCSIYSGLAVISAVFIFLKRLKMKKNMQTGSKTRIGAPIYKETEKSYIHHYQIYYVLIIYILFYMAIIFWRAMNFPVLAWDSISTSIFKSKIFYFEHNLNLLKSTPRPSYPLQIPLFATWVSMNLQQWNDQLFKIIFPLNFISFLTIEYYFLRCYTKKVWAMLGVALVVSSEYCVSYAPIEYREITLMMYNCGAVFMLILWFHKRQDCLLIIAGILSGLGTFTKLEGNGYLLIHIALLVLVVVMAKDMWKTKLIQITRFMLPASALVLFYLYFKGNHGVIAAERSSFDFQLQDFNRIPVILETFIRFVFLRHEWNILWPVCMLSLLNLYKRKHGVQTWLILVSILMYFSLLFLVILLTENYHLIIGPYYDQLNLPRLFLHFFPLVTVAIILLNFSSKEPTEVSDISCEIAP